MASQETPSQHTTYLQRYLRGHSNKRLSTTKSKRQQNEQVEDPNYTTKKAASNRPFLSRESTFTVKSSSCADSLRQRPQTSMITTDKTIKLPKQQGLPFINHARNKKFKASAENIPDEIISAIFWKLPIGDLITASQVCRRWYRVAGDNLLWKRYYNKFVGPTSNEPEDKVVVQDLDRCCWKKLCLKRCKVKRDQMYLKKWRHPDSYTGLKQRPELTLG
ncbi:S-phase kinase-associated protein 2 [Elysia marginata]|uniref:S-phase kinase-associated protein 2 n=1 Tax=Elysia marginata TaxID=1093978 RepID=A0AAV4HVL5_9GAST|nr:S-phase kinase-associated protein 2 [Elysia marginata]